eukprot:2478704-Pleurochrysis_carterae.AAC.1
MCETAPQPETRVSQSLRSTAERALHSFPKIGSSASLRRRPLLLPPSVPRTRHRTSPSNELHHVIRRGPHGVDPFERQLKLRRAREKPRSGAERLNKRR